MSRSRRIRAAFPDLGLALGSIAGFWLLYLATLLIRIYALGDEGPSLLRRILGVLIGAGLTFVLYLVIRRAAGESLRMKIVVAAIAGLPAAAIFSTFNIAFFLYQPLVTQAIAEKGAGGVELTRTPDGRLIVEQPDGTSIEVQVPPIQEILRKQAPRILVDGTVNWYFFFAAWASFYIAMSSAVQLRAAERRAAQFERQAQSAQLRALRYQINPHFLFNTLNSLSSLVMGRRDEEAESMIVNLSTFFRSSLAIDPTEDVTLAREIELQRLYLDIEQVRFPNRLQVETDIAPEAAGALVPALLLQPLVENAIKHGVARSVEPVTLGIAARAEDGRLEITVSNSAGGGAAASDHEDDGTGVGLVNVCERLAARFGDQAECDFGALPGGGYRVALSMPLVSHDG